jgi:hypothetical protein
MGLTFEDLGQLLLDVFEILDRKQVIEHVVQVLGTHLPPALVVGQVADLKPLYKMENLVDIDVLFHEKDP